MTGNVPYYGGRFTAQQAYAAAHPYTGGPGPTSAVPRFGPPPPAPPPPAPPPPAAPGSGAPMSDPLSALQQLFDAGVITRDELQQLRARAGQ